MKPFLCKDCGETDFENITVNYRPKVETFEYFKETVIANHLDVYLFDRAVYLGQTKQIEIGCKKHGNYFWVSAGTLLRRTERNGGSKKNPEVGSCSICREEYFTGIKDNIINKCRQAHNNEYEYGEYINLKTPLMVICKIHGEFKVMPNNHSNGGSKCPDCYSILSRHKNIKYVDLQKYYICDIHGDVPIGKSRNVEQGCPKCSEIKRNEEQVLIFKKKLNNKFGKYYDIEITVKKMVFRCKKHLTKTTVNRAGFKIGKRNCFCDYCNTERIDKIKKETREKLETKCRDIINTDYMGVFEFLEFIDGDNIQASCVKLNNLINGGIKEVTARQLLKKTLSVDINKCVTKESHMSFDDAKALMRKLDITSLRQYKNWRRRTYQPTLPSNPHRSYKEWISHYDFFGTDVEKDMSSGELRIKDYLERKGLEYEFQKKYDDCRNINPLPFDFYVPRYNLIIEFDGSQHYKNNGRFCNLKTVQKHDAIKNKYCEDNNINMLRIPYWELEDNNVEWTLDNEICRISAEIAIS